MPKKTDYPSQPASPGASRPKENFWNWHTLVIAAAMAAGHVAGHFAFDDFFEEAPTSAPIAEIAAESIQPTNKAEEMIVLWAVDFEERAQKNYDECLADTTQRVRDGVYRSACFVRPCDARLQRNLVVRLETDGFDIEQLDSSYCTVRIDLENIAEKSGKKL